MEFFQNRVLDDVSEDPGGLGADVSNPLQAEVCQYSKPRMHEKTMNWKPWN